jgi:hypothetical protein
MLTVMSVAPIISVLLTALMKKPVAKAAEGLARVSKLSMAKVSRTLQSASSLGWVLAAAVAVLCVLWVGGAGFQGGEHSKVAGAARLHSSASPHLSHKHTSTQPRPRSRKNSVDFAAMLAANPEMANAAHISPDALARIGGGGNRGSMEAIQELPAAADADVKKGASGKDKEADGEP